MKKILFIMGVFLLAFSSCKKDADNPRGCWTCQSSYDGSDRGTHCGTWEEVSRLRDANGTSWNCAPKTP